MKTPPRQRWLDRKPTFIGRLLLGAALFGFLAGMLWIEIKGSRGDFGREFQQGECLFWRLECPR